MKDEPNGKCLEASQPVALINILGNPYLIIEYIANEPERTYFELYEMYKKISVTSRCIGNLSLVHGKIIEFISREHPGEEGEKAISEMDKWRKQAKTTLKLIGFG